MAIKAYVISEAQQGQKLQIDGVELRDILGDREEAVAVQINELFNAITESVASDLTSEGELEIEITGSIALKAEGGVKWLFINAGGSATSTDTMKVKLKTKIGPKAKTS